MRPLRGLLFHATFVALPCRRENVSGDEGSFTPGMGWKSPPMTCVFDNKQSVAFAAGPSSMASALPEWLVYSYLFAPRAACFLLYSAVSDGEHSISARSVFGGINLNRNLSSATQGLV